MKTECKLCSGWGRWTEIIHGQICSGECSRCRGRGTVEILPPRRFWLVTYYPATLNRASWDTRRRHSRVRLFFDPHQAAAFADQVWHSRDWRLLSEVEVERTGIGFRHVLPF
jgi:hypothetical protein